MAYIARSYSGKAQATTLVAGIGTTDVTFKLTSVSSWLEAPGYTNNLGTSGPFVVALDYNTNNEEKILCSSFDAGDGTVTVATGGRGYDGTPAVTHSSLASAVVVWSALEAEELNNVAQQTLGAATTAGDLLYASAPNTLTRLPIGTTGQLLSVASGGPAWAAPYVYTPPVQPYIMATLGTDQAVTTTASPVKFSGTYGSILGATGEKPTLNTTTGIITVNKTGLYSIVGNLSLLAAFNTYKLTTKLRINGANPWAFGGPIQPDGALYSTANSTLEIALTAGWTIELLVLADTAPGLTLKSDGSSTYYTSLSAAYLGPIS